MKISKIFLWIPYNNRRSKKQTKAPDFATTDGATLKRTVATPTSKNLDQRHLCSLNRSVEMCI